jgi:hypothetical protein
MQHQQHTTGNNNNIGRQNQGPLVTNKNGKIPNVEEDSSSPLIVMSKTFKNGDKYSGKLELRAQF